MSDRARQISHAIGQLSHRWCGTYGCRRPGARVTGRAFPVVLTWLLLPAGAPGAQESPTFVNLCQVTFQLPAGWIRVSEGPDDGGESACAALVRPMDWERRLVEYDGLDAFTISIEVLPLGFDSSLPLSPFDQDGGQWWTGGRQGLRHPAETIIGRGWHGLSGLAPVGCYQEEGGYVGACEVPVALIGTSERAVLIWGKVRSEDAFETVLRSARFLP